jgi:uncharacterized protein (UPF0305 family)
MYCKITELYFAIIYLMSYGVICMQDARFVEERRRRLQHYLRCVVNHLVQTNIDLATAPDKELLIGLVPFFG